MSDAMIIPARVKRACLPQEAGRMAFGNAENRLNKIPAARIA